MRPEIPPALLVEEPVPPPLAAGDTFRDLTGRMLDLEAGLLSCNGRLGRLRALLVPP